MRERVVGATYGRWERVLTSDGERRRVCDVDVLAGVGYLAIRSAGQNEKRMHCVSSYNVHLIFNGEYVA